MADYYKKWKDNLSILLLGMEKWCGCLTATNQIINSSAGIANFGGSFYLEEYLAKPMPTTRPVVQADSQSG